MKLYYSARGVSVQESRIPKACVLGLPAPESLHPPPPNPNSEARKKPEG